MFLSFRHTSYVYSLSLCAGSLFLCAGTSPTDTAVSTGVSIPYFPLLLNPLHEYGSWPCHMQTESRRTVFPSPTCDALWHVRPLATLRFRMRGHAESGFAHALNGG